MDRKATPIPAAAAGACPCTLERQDDTCPVGYPSLLCEECDGTGALLGRGWLNPPRHPATNIGE